MTELLSEAAAWTATIGFHNWPVPFPRRVVTAGVDRGEVHVGEVHVGEVDPEVDPVIVAALTLQWSDELFWGDQPDDGASGRVRAEGRSCLRLDVSADNLPLSAFYERLGFVYRGEREGELIRPGGGIRRWKTRLYERDCHEESTT